MKNTHHLLTLAAVALLAGSAAQAQTLTGFTRISTKAEMLSVQGAKADFDANGMAVGNSGTLYVIDSDSQAATTGQSIIRVIPGTPNTIGLMADQTQMVNAIEAVNGTTAVTSFSPRQIAVLQNGNIVVTGFTNVANADTILILTNAAPATISVLHTSVNGADSAIDGVEAMITIGNTIYAATNENNGNATTADAIIAFDGTGTGPALAGTTIINKAGLEAAFGVANESAVNALATDGTDLFGTISVSATAPDVVGRITTAGVATVHINKTSVVNALAALDPLVTDVGYGAIAVDANGTVYLANSFGTSASAYDDTIVAVSNISAGAGTVTTISKSALATILALPSGTPFVGNDSLAFDATNNRIVFSEGSSTSPSGEGQWFFSPVAPASSVTNWDLHE